MQGVQVTTDANTVHAAGQILIGGVNYYRKCDITGLKRGYSYSGDPIAMTPVVMFEGQKLTEDKDYTVNYKNSSGEDVMANELSGTGWYTITITGMGDYYTGTYTANFFILMPEDISGYVFQKGIDDEGEYYEISSATKYEYLGSLVAYVDNATKGLRFKLTDNISVTTMIGTNEDTRSFQGIFDGNGKTLTVTLSGGDDDKFLAPFRYTKAATIRNLTVAGSISSTRDGDGTNGGFVGINNNETTFENCVFTGSLLGDEANRCGGFVGWNNGTLHYIDCLFNPAVITMSSDGSATFNRNGNNDFVRTYYLTPFGEKQGTHVYASKVDGIVSSSTTAADGKTYYIAMYYTIASEEDWKALAQLVLNDQKDDLPVELLDDITVTTSIGTRYHPFRGRFLGNGKTLTVNLNAGEDDQFLAPFSHVSDATFSNLTVAGTITSTVEGDGTHGGFVGISNGNTSFEKCIFTGSLLGDKTNCCGGFVGWNNSRLTFTDCLFAPTEITMSSKGSATFNCNYDGTFVRTYFLTPFGEKQGKQAFTSSEAAVAEGVIIAPITFFNGDTYYVDCGLKTDNTIAEGEPGHFYINMSDRDLDYYTIPSGVTSLKIYDNGGKDGNASHNCDSKLVLSVPEGCLIQTSGTVFTYDGFWDYLYIYDGDSYYSSDCLGKYQGAPATVGPLISSKEAMRFYFACWDDNDKCNVDLTVNIINLKLDDKLDNTSKITAKADSKVNAILTDRTLYKDGDWNTLCLPFDLVLEGSPLEGATVKELAVEEKFLYPNSQYLISENGIYQTGYDASTGTLSLYFKEATSIEAGKPYLIKWPQAIPHIKNPVFTDVTVTATTPSTITSTDGYVSFVGTYSPTDIFSAEKTNLYIGADNTLYYPWADNMEHFYINSCRGYFQLNKGLTAGDPSAVKEFRLNFGEEDSADGIENVQCSMFNVQCNDAWYDLSGRRLGGKPTQKGIYINNGIKVAIK